MKKTDKSFVGETFLKPGEVYEVFGIYQFRLVFIQNVLIASKHFKLIVTEWLDCTGSLICLWVEINQICQRSWRT
jgi:hypothetical protein